MPWQSESNGTSTYVVMCGGLYIETPALKTLGVWLRVIDSGWVNVQAPVQVDIALPGIADSFLLATLVAHTRRAHQVTVADIYIYIYIFFKALCL